MKSSSSSSKKVVLFEKKMTRDVSSFTTLSEEGGFSPSLIQSHIHMYTHMMPPESVQKEG